MSRIVVFKGKRVDLDKFEPRAKRCSHCPALQEFQPKLPDKVQCGLFGWELDRNLSKKTAVCSRTGKAAKFSVTMSDNQVLYERKQNMGV